MKIYDCELRFDKKFISKWNFIPEINFNEGTSKNIYTRFLRIEDCNILVLNILKMFNSNILDFDMELGAYYIKIDSNKERLGLDNLGRGERLFLLCMMADKLQETIIVSGELNLLSGEYVKIFVSMFKDSPYIELLPPTVTCKYIYERMLENI